MILTSCAPNHLILTSEYCPDCGKRIIGPVEPAKIEQTRAHIRNMIKQIQRTAPPERLVTRMLALICIESGLTWTLGEMPDVKFIDFIDFIGSFTRDP